MRRLYSVIAANRDTAEWPGRSVVQRRLELRGDPAASSRTSLLAGASSDDLDKRAHLDRLYDLPSNTHTEAAERFGVYFELAMVPMFRPHGATDLVAKGHLADGLRRGLEQLGLGTDLIGVGATRGDMPNISRRYDSSCHRSVSKRFAIPCP